MNEWLTVDDVDALRGPVGRTRRGDREAVLRMFRNWRAQGYPLVEERPRDVGGVYLVVRRVELEHHIPSWFRQRSERRAA